MEGYSVEGCVNRGCVDAKSSDGVRPSGRLAGSSEC
jgi:hypothetical protein